MLEGTLELNTYFNLHSVCGRYTLPSMGIRDYFEGRTWRYNWFTNQVEK